MMRIDAPTAVLAAAAAFVATSLLASAGILGMRWDQALGRGPTLVGGSSAITSNGAKTVRIGVSSPIAYRQYDDIGSLLRELGGGFAFRTIRLDQLAERGRLDGLEALFLGCAAELGPRVAMMPQMANFTKVSVLNRPGYANAVALALEKFVADGGALYCSDWAATLLELAFPGEVQTNPIRFPSQRVRAHVDDKGLRALLGPTLDLTFETDLWVAIDRPAQGQVYLGGSVSPAGGGISDMPLLVGFRHGKGQVLYTSFHNEHQRSEAERTLLRYLVLKPLTLRASRQANEALLAQQYAVGQESLFSVGQQRKFTFTAAAGHALGFVLAWEDPGDGTVSLELKVRDPAGKVTSRQAQRPPVVVEIPASTAGEYTYEVVPSKVPYANFPYVATVGVR